MDSIGLTVDRGEFLKALDVIRSLRKRRAATLPITLKYRRGELVVQKAGRWKPVSCSIPASGSWVPFGATVDLLYLRDAIERARLAEITLHVLEDAILVPLSETMRVRLRLIDFELDRVPPGPIATELPLFQWAEHGNAPSDVPHHGSPPGIRS